MIEGAGKMDAKFFIEKIKLDKRYEALQLSKALDMNIEGLIVNKDLASMQYADVFECIDINIIKNIASSLVKGSLDFETFEKIIASRINSMWYENTSLITNFYRRLWLFQGHWNSLFLSGNLHQIISKITLKSIIK